MLDLPGSMRILGRRLSRRLSVGQKGVIGTTRDLSPSLLEYVGWRCFGVKWWLEGRRLLEPPSWEGRSLKESIS